MTATGEWDEKKRGRTALSYGISVIFFEICDIIGVLQASMC